jgi:biopolymer transport protein ExbB
MQDMIWLSWWTHADLVVRGVFLVLMVMSLATWAVIVYKLMQLTAWNALEKQAAQALRKGDLDAVEKLPADAPTRQLLEAAQQLIATRPVVPHDVQDRMDDLQAPIRMDQETFLTVLATIGSCAPFVGLLGTVWGIMHALQTLSGKELTLEAISGPVGEALVATAAGLFAAIPALISYNLLVRGLRHLNAHTAANSRGVVDALFAKRG